MLLHFVKISYYIMRRYYISQQFFITLCVGITFRNDFLLHYAEVLHFATFFYYIMRRYYISQRFCITLCVGITFRNVYYIMRFNRRVLPASALSFTRSVIGLFKITSAKNWVQTGKDTKG